MSDATISTILFDLDGVIRHFDPSHVIAVEAQHDLAPGALQSAAFAPEVIEPVITGAVSRADWVAQVGEIVGNPAAATAWLTGPGRDCVDEEMLALVDRLRALGLTVAILTNGTDTIGAEMIELGLVDRFDAIFNSAEIGYAKPDVRSFRHVCDALDVDPRTVFFTDDTPSKLPGALELGMTARLFTSFDQLVADLKACDIET